MQCNSKQINKTFSCKSFYFYQANTGYLRIVMGTHQTIGYFIVSFLFVLYQDFIVMAIKSVVPVIKDKTKLLEKNTRRNSLLMLKEFLC